MTLARFVTYVPPERRAGMLEEIYEIAERSIVAAQGIQCLDRCGGNAVDGWTPGCSGCGPSKGLWEDVILAPLEILRLFNPTADPTGSYI